VPIALITSCSIVLSMHALIIACSFIHAIVYYSICVTSYCNISYCVMQTQIPMGETFPNASAQALDLIQQCLQFNPDKRISSIDALKHPYVAEFHNPDDEPDYPHGPIRIVIER
jgi:serine/threonine protein kinase